MNMDDHFDPKDLWELWQLHFPDITSRRELIDRITQKVQEHERRLDEHRLRLIRLENQVKKLMNMMDLIEERGEHLKALQAENKALRAALGIDEDALLKIEGDELTVIPLDQQEPLPTQSSESEFDLEQFRTQIEELRESLQLYPDFEQVLTEFSDEMDASDEESSSASSSTEDDSSDSQDLEDV